MSFSTFKEFFSLLALNLVVKKRNFFEYLKVVYRYYSQITFAKIDLFLWSHYLFQNPFKISKQFLLARGATEDKEIYGYGETPLTTLEQIALISEIKKEDKFFELGSGRGKGCFWLRIFIGCSVVGIEFVPQFVQIANRVKNKFSLKDIEFRQEDLLDSSFLEGTVFYLYGSNLEADFIRKLVEKFKKLPAGTKIITVSYPLSDYDESSSFKLIKKFEGVYTWGKATIYLQSIK